MQVSTNEVSMMPPALENLSSSYPSSKPLSPSSYKKQSKSLSKRMSSSSKPQCHKNAVQRIQNQLADSKEHIDRTVLPSSSSFGGRPCLNMKVFLKLMSDKNKKQHNLDALYSLVEHDSDSIIGFVELNGLSFINEWLFSTKTANDHWFSLCILQFLAHQNLYITYEALNTARIVKTVKQFINPSSDTNSNSASSAIPITDEIRALLPSNLDISRPNDNFIQVIDRNVLHSVCHQHKDLNTIRYLQSQFANRVVNKWKKFVGEWKKHKFGSFIFLFLCDFAIFIFLLFVNMISNRPLYRSVRFSDEKCKALADSTTFHLMDPPMIITQQRDKKRREKMNATMKWMAPQKFEVDEILDSDSKPIERGRDSKEKKVQKERIMQEMEEFSIGTDNLKDPKMLSSNQSVKNVQKPVIIPLESEQSTPTPEAQKTANANPNGSNTGQQPVGAAVPYNHMMPPHAGHGHGHYAYPPPPHHMYGGYAQHPHQSRLPPPPGYHPQYPYHPNMPPPPPGYPGYPPQYRPPPGHYPAYAMPQQQQPQSVPANAAAPVSSASVSSSDAKNGSSNHRRREYEVDRPAKRQKIDHYADTDRDYRRGRGDSRKKHRSSKHEKSRHKSSRRRKDGMQIDEYSFRYHAKTCFCETTEYTVIEYFDDDDAEQTEYLFIVYMFAFWAFCYVLKKYGMIW